MGTARGKKKCVIIHYLCNSMYIDRKVKLSLCHAVEDDEVVVLKPLLFTSPALNGRQCSASWLDCFTPGEREYVGSQSWFGHSDVEVTFV